jgi:hypothetical protein
MVQPFYGVGGSCSFPLRRVKAGEGKQTIPGFLKAIGDRAAFQPPFAHKYFAALFYLGRRLGIDHVAVIIA